MIRTARLVFLLVASLSLFAQKAGEDSWKKLEDGNAIFKKGPDLTFKDVVGKRNKDQKPRIAVIACADSRVSPELVFHQNLLDIFVIRTAGNVADEFAIASLEYAASKPREWLDLIVVVGHSHCGAVDAALKPGDPGTPALRALVRRIQEAFPNPPKPRLEEAIQANARQVARSLPGQSTLLREAVRSGKIQVVAAYYDMKEGEVMLLK